MSYGANWYGGRRGKNSSGTSEWAASLLPRPPNGLASASYLFLMPHGRPFCYVLVLLLRP
jgi:hypothetical protein